MRGLRKRYLVSEGELFQLYKEVQQIRNQELRNELYSKFKELLKNAQEVKITPVTPKTTNHEQ